MSRTDAITAVFLSILPQSKAEAATDGGAMVAALSPTWLPYLRDTSELAGLVLPILGVAWLLLQIGLKVHAAYRGRNT